MNRNIIPVVAAGLLLQSLVSAGPAAAAVFGGALVSPINVVPSVPVKVISLPGSYVVTVLPLDYIAGMGDGIIVGEAKGVPVAYVNGKVEPLPIPAGYSNVSVAGISSNGYIIGSANFTPRCVLRLATTCTQQRGLFWSSYTNVPVDMGVLGSLMIPASVNSSGVAVGWYYPKFGPVTPDEVPTAFEWSMSGGAHSIAPRYSTLSFAFAISDSGYVAGTATYGDDQAVTRWYPGSFQAGTVTEPGYAWRVEENGTVYSPTTAWDLSNQPRNIAPDAYAEVMGISAVGREVGFTAATSTTNGAFTVPPGGGARQLLPNPAGGLNSQANFVDGCGSIAGNVNLSNGTSEGVLWTKMTCDQQQLAVQ